MVRRMIAAAMVIGGMLAAGRTETARGQQQQPDPQQMQQQMLNRMQRQGVDPQQLGQQIRDQMQQGTFDPQQFIQNLVQQGVLDPAMITQLQSRAQQRQLDALRTQLGASDQEWALLLPPLQKILTLRAQLAQVGGGGGGVANLQSMAFASFAGAPSPLVKARDELRRLAADPATPSARVALALQAFREARDKLRTDLTASQDDLVKMLTVQQEATLLAMGYLN